ncbi:hypothetical protein DFS34DRAFT_649820 [Phlyctochytrium arcticum]|nr:hypothetical protein DFS34DRAFT_649820 [Phlyctochytrium arcticum]
MADFVFTDAGAGSAGANSTDIPLVSASFLEEISLFVNHLATDPSRAFRELPHVAAGLVGFLVLPSLLWFSYRTLTANSQSNSVTTIKGWKSKTFLEEAEEVADNVKNAPVEKVVFDVGISAHAVAVSQDGLLRAFHVIPKGSVSAAHISAAVVKAVALPIETDHNVYRPQIVAFLESRQCTPAVLNAAIKRLTQVLGPEVKVAPTEKIADQVKAITEERKSALANASSVNDAAANGAAGVKLDANGKPAFVPTPDRGCFVCKQEITEKPSQCSACKAIIYCSPECAKKDWPTHKQVCPQFKTYMARIEKENLHDLPFDYYNSKKQLHNYNQVTLLIHSDVHNVGVYRRLCHCYQQTPYGELAGQQIQHLQANNIQDPLERFKLFGLNMHWFPLSNAYPDGLDTRSIDTWEKFYNARSIPMSDPAALVFEVPMTIWHIINKYLLDTLPALPAPTSADTPAPRRQITIHLLGAEKEADLSATFELLLSLLPKTDISIHMISPAISPRLPPTHSTLGIRNESLDSTLIVTLRQGPYSPEFYTGEAFAATGLPFGAGKPDLVVMLNAGLLANASWGPTMKLLIENRVKTIVTEEMEHSCELILKQLEQIGCNVSLKTTVNPFRQPVYLWKRDTNLPGWSNGFMIGLN